ncbi:hypothetical protein C9I57_18900 [Trinickia symbiotica]|uniref:RiboL-PSP-HEPN domain-containing protein n=2 Tax=Trinickia symbiotica TaxID=863227 RepID=A0A2T3XRL8_9BURK|nr:hypothetical protein C9I57_18900 [Trinickia symbiotica]
MHEKGALGGTARWWNENIWGYMSELLFDADHWYWKALEDFVAYRDMDKFLRSGKAFSAYADSMILHASDDNDESATRAKLVESLRDSLTGSLDHFASLTIVAMCSTFEVAAKEFYENVFFRHPKRMHEYLGKEKQLGVVQLSDVVEAGDYHRLLHRLAQRAAANATKGKYGDILARAFKIAGSPNDRDLTDRLNGVQMERNRVVHEKEVLQRDVKALDATHSILADAIGSLAQLALNLDVPGSYTCVSPVGTFVVNEIAGLLPGVS